MKKNLNNGGNSGVKYIITSVIAFIVDNGIYNLLFFVLGKEKTVLAQLTARVISSTCQCNLNYFWVFGKNGEYVKSVIKYYCLCIPQTFVSTVLLTMLINRLSVSTPILATAIKIVIEAVLFAISFFIQKYWVFKKKS